MTLIEALQAHKGGLVRIKSQLYWYGRGWDGVHDRVCLLLNAAAEADDGCVAVTADLRATLAAPTAALLLVDGAPHWVWVAKKDVELL